VDLPSNGGRSLADQIDLDSDAPLTPKSPAPKASPKAQKDQSVVGGDLFADLLGVKDKLARPAAPPPPAKTPAPAPPASAMGDDPFADIEVSVPKATAPPAAAPPKADAPETAPASGLPAADLFDGLGDPFAGVDPAAAPAPAPKPAIKTPALEPAKKAPEPAKAPAPKPAIKTPAPEPAKAPAPPEPAPPDSGFELDGDPFAAAGPALDVPADGPAAEAPPAGGDPFADTPAPPDPFAPVTESESPGLDFGADDLGADPFGSQGPDDQAPAAAPQQPAPGSPDDDPFASIDLNTTEPPAGAPAGMDTETADAAEFLAKDPFSQMDDAGGGMPKSATEMPSGLELDQDGKLVGEAAPPPSPPMKAVRPEETDAAAPEPVAAPVPIRPPPRAAVAAPPTKIAWLYKLVFSLVALVLALFLFVAYRSGGTPDLGNWSTYVEAFTGKSAAEEAVEDLVPVKVTNTAYTNHQGHSLVILWGEVKNTTEEKKRAVVVQGKMVDGRGKVIGEFTAPAGISFTPLQAFQMGDRLAVEAAYRARLPKVAKLEIGPDKTAPFMIIFHDHPADLDDVEFRLVPSVNTHPLRGLPPAPRPTAEPAGDEQPTEAKRKPGTSGASARGVVVKKKGTFVRMRPPAEEP
jgi:hypothetical protein